MSLSFIHNIHIYKNYNQSEALSISQKKILNEPDTHVKNRGAARCTCLSALLTVEMAVVLPLFICFMVFILYFFRVLQVQAGVSQALQYAGRRIAAEYSGLAEDVGESDGYSKTEETINDPAGYSKTGETVNDPAGYQKAGGIEDQSGKNGNGAGVLGLLRAKVLFEKNLKKQKCPVQYISCGITGISLIQSDFTGNYVELKAVYRMKLPVALLGDLQYRIVQTAKCRKWTGFVPGQDMEQEDIWFYYTQYGTVYHASRSCTHLDLSIRGVTYAQAGSSRNKSGGKYHKCEKCADSLHTKAMVYITDYGDRYHSSLTCSGLKRTIYMIRKSEAVGKRMCSKCGS